MTTRSIKLLLQRQQYDEALSLLVSVSGETSDPNERIQLSKYLDAIPVDHWRQRQFLVKKIAVLPGYTTSFLTGLLRIELLHAGICASIYESGYGSFEQVIYSRDAGLTQFGPDITYFCVGSDHLTSEPVEAEVERWCVLWQAAHELLRCEIVQNTFEEPLHRTFINFEAKHADSASNRVRSINAQLARRAPRYVHFSDVNFLAGAYGRRVWRDESLYDMAKIPVSFDCWIPYANSVASVCSSIFGRTRKCLVLDLDNTLWGGVVGDDGVAGIEIGEDTAVGRSFTRFQRYVKSLKDRGVILAVCSKNDEAVAKEPFLRRNEMVLSLDDFSCFVANWDLKPRNLAVIADTLDLALDSFVFVDDSPAERQLVREHLPQVAVPDLPDDPAHYARALSETYFFDTVAVTKEDLGRATQYRATTEARRLASTVADYSAFLRSLDMEAVVRRFDEVHLPRIAQLINKTNQFNLTTKRYSETEVADIARSPHAITRYVTLTDRYGDHGLIAVFIGFPADDGTLEIDTWLMSCRVLKRQVEDLLLRNVVREACSRGTKRIRGRYVANGRNKLVESLYADFGFTVEAVNGDGQVTWTLDLSNRPAVERILSKDVAIHVLETEPA